jgi:hypothetical protein
MKLFILSACLIGFVAAQAPVGGSKDPRCPATEDSKNPTHLAHATDCGKFLKCNRGSAITMSCPEGQHWNEARKYCDTVANAKCAKGSPMQWQPPQPTPRPPVNQRPNVPQQRPNIPPNRPTIEHPDYLDCPEVDRRGQIVYFPYHLNCSQFYQCVNGRAVL